MSSNPHAAPGLLKARSFPNRGNFARVRRIFQTTCSDLGSTSIRVFRKLLQKTPSPSAEPLLEPRGTVAMTAWPGLATIKVAALAPVMSVLHFDQVKKLLPIGSFLLERRRAIANLHPPNLARQLSGIMHIARKFTFGNRSLPQRPADNGFEQRLLASRFKTRPDQITHLSSRLNCAIHARLAAKKRSGQVCASMRPVPGSVSRHTIV